MNRLRRSARKGRTFWLLVGALIVSLGAWAQDSRGERDAEEYQIEEGRRDGQHGEEDRDSGPVRLARFSFVDGNVTWRAGMELDWSEASINLPIRQGAQVYVPDGSRAELQFDDGTILRLGAGALATLQTLYSDADGAFTGIRMTEGLASLNLRHKLSVYQMDTPYASMKAVGPAKVRVGVGESVEIAVREGKATVEGRNGEAELRDGDYLEMRDADDPFDVRPLPRADNWDRWNQDRDLRLEEARERGSNRNLPPNVALAAPDLDDYGTWRNDPEYGQVWCPRVTVANWRPYHFGRWVWVSPFGWTWVSNEPWGWAPYHYGTWVNRSWGWGWVPGPVTQYWSPAVVHFCETDGGVAWVPLAPREVYYPTTLSFGFRRADWFLYFSIGQAAVYYPGSGSYCEPRPWRNRFVNQYTQINVTNVNNYFGSGQETNGRNLTGSQRRFMLSKEYLESNRNTYARNSRFIPQNATVAAGMTASDVGVFGGRGAYRMVGHVNKDFFASSRAIGAPDRGVQSISGPVVVKPSASALTPSRNFLRGVQPPQSSLERPTYRGRLPQDPSGTRALPSTINGNAASGKSIDRFSGSREGQANGGFGNLPRDRSGRTPRVSPNYENARPSDNGIPDRPRVRQPDDNTNRVIPGGRDSRLGGARNGDNPSKLESGSKGVEETIIRARGSVGLPARVTPGGTEGVMPKGTGGNDPGTGGILRQYRGSAEGQNRQRETGNIPVSPRNDPGYAPRYTDRSNTTLRRDRPAGDIPDNVEFPNRETRTPRGYDNTRIPGAPASPPNGEYGERRNSVPGGYTRQRPAETGRESPFGQPGTGRRESPGYRSNPGYGGGVPYNPPTRSQPSYQPPSNPGRGVPMNSGTTRTPPRSSGSGRMTDPSKRSRPGRP